MDWPHESTPWLSFPVECFWYFLPGIVPHFIFFSLSLLIFSAFAGFTSTQKPNLSLQHVLVFQFVFLIVTLITNGLWSCLVFGNLYWSADYTSDYSPFYPIFRQVIEAKFGNQIGALNNINLLQLNLVWCLFLSFNWGASLLLTGFRFKRRTKKFVYS